MHEQNDVLKKENTTLNVIERHRSHVFRPYTDNSDSLYFVRSFCFHVQTDRFLQTEATQAIDCIRQGHGMSTN